MIPLTEKFICMGCHGKTVARTVPVDPKQIYILQVCATCQLVHLRPKPLEKDDCNQSADASIYAAAVDHLCEGFRFHHEKLLNLLIPFSSPPGHLLEIGSSQGDFLRAAQGHGYAVWGIEPARNPGIKGIPENRVLNESVERVSLPSNHFDVVVAIQVIEHLHDPLAFVKKMFDVLTPGGILYLETPNYDSLARRLRFRRFMQTNVAPGHWHLFNRWSISALTERNGYDFVRSWTFFKALSAYGRGPFFSWFVGVLNLVFGSVGLGNTLAILVRKGNKK